MILQRYLLKDIFSHTGAVGLVFLLVILASRSIQYLEQVSRGELSSDIVFWVILFRLPEFLEIIIPLSFFLGTVLVVGRLCSDNEMIIFEQNGYSNEKIFKLFLMSSLVFALITSLLSFWITPSFKSNLEDITNQTSFKEDFNSIQPGKFVTLEDNSVFYAEDKKEGLFVNVFLKFPNKDLPKSTEFLSAQHAFISQEDPNVVIFEDGYTFNKDKDKKIKMNFRSLLIDLDSNLSRTPDELNESVNNKTELSVIDFTWKISMPLLTVIAVFLALPLSRVSPRKGRYSRVLPCILVFLIYLGLLLLVKGWLDEGKVLLSSSLLLIHFCFFLSGLYFMSRFSFIKNLP